MLRTYCLSRLLSCNSRKKKSLVSVSCFWLFQALDERETSSLGHSFVEEEQSG